MRTPISYLFFALLYCLLCSNVQAEETPIPTGFQLQAQAEKNTSMINTQDLKKMLDDLISILASSIVYEISS